MKLLTFIIVILYCVVCWACLDAAARADEQAQRMYDEWKKRKKQKFEK